MATPEQEAAKEELRKAQQELADFGLQTQSMVSSMTRLRSNTNIAILRTIAQNNILNSKIQTTQREMAVTKAAIALKQAELNVTTANITKLKTQQDKLGKSLAAAETEFPEKQKELVLIKQSQKIKLKEIQSLQSQISAAEQERAASERKVAELKNYNSASAELTKDLESQRAASGRTIDRLKFLNESYTSEISEINKALTQVRTKYKNGQKMSEVDQSLIAEYQTMLASAQNHRAENKKTIDIEIANRRALSSQIAQTQDEVNKNKEAIARENFKHMDLTAKLGQLGIKLTDSQSALAQQNFKHMDVTARLMELGNKLADLPKELEKNKNKLKEATDAQHKTKLKLTELQTQAVRQAEELKTLEIKKVKNALDGISKTVNTFAKALMGFVDKIYETQQTVGVEMGSASRIYGNALLSRAKSLVGLTGGPILDAKEIIDATKAFKSEFGTILSPGEAEKIAGEAKRLGVSSDEYVKAKRAFLGTGANEDTVRQNAIQQFKNAGLAGADAIKFAAENADLLAVAGEKYSDSLFRAAAEAKKIGVNLSDIEKFANNIVGDFEGSLEKFSELSAMGIELDFNQIAAVSATGTDEEILNTLKQQLQQSGIRGEELQTNRQLRLALTQATGMDESTIMRLSGQAAAPKEATIPEQQLGVLEKILERLAGWGTILGTIATSAAQFIPAIMSLRTGGGISGLLGKGGAAGTASKVSEVSKVAEVTGGEGLTSAAKGTSAFSGNNILKGAAAMLVVAASVYVLAKGLQQFSTVNWADMGKAAVSIGVLALAAFGLSSIAPEIGIGALAIAALGASMIPFAFALNLAAPGLGTLSSFVGVLSQLNLAQVGILTLMGPALASMAVGLSALGVAAVVAAPGLAILGGLQKLGILPNMPGAGTPVTGPAPAGATGAAANAAGAKLDTSKMEAKLDQVVTAIKGMKIEMDGHTVGRVSLNAASPLGRLAVVG
jgi:hypothetical protein